jgi:hypothetical protein
VQRDKKLMSYDITDKGGKPYVRVQVAGEDKVSGAGAGRAPCARRGAQTRRQRRAAGLRMCVQAHVHTRTHTCTHTATHTIHRTAARRRCSAPRRSAR